jgi:hypothetical protein
VWRTHIITTLLVGKLGYPGAFTQDSPYVTERAFSYLSIQVPKGESNASGDILYLLRIHEFPVEIKPVRTKSYLLLPKGE